MLRASAKVNLVLEVLGKRPDGYHELSTVMQAVDLFDRLTVEAAATITLETSEPALPTDDRQPGRARGAACCGRRRASRRERGSCSTSASRSRRGWAADRVTPRRPCWVSTGSGAPLAPREARGAGGEARHGRAVLPRDAGGPWERRAVRCCRRCRASVAMPWCSSIRGWGCRRKRCTDACPGVASRAGRHASGCWMRSRSGTSSAWRRALTNHLERWVEPAMPVIGRMKAALLAAGRARRGHVGQRADRVRSRPIAGPGETDPASRESRRAGRHGR